MALYLHQVSHAFMPIYYCGLDLFSLATILYSEKLYIDILMIRGKKISKREKKMKKSLSTKQPK